MPAGQPGSLTHEQYEDVFSYILQQNGYPAGTTKLYYTASLSSTVPLVSRRSRDLQAGASHRLRPPHAAVARRASMSQGRSEKL